MLVLGISRKGDRLGAVRVTIVVLPDTGHWIVEERPQETTGALLNFL
jgi:pimeloyl-ACP methyl ester carboxylesterase